MTLTNTIPLSLYIHMPWCIRKCPYCDFNSHELSADWPQKEYIASLIDDLEHDLAKIWGRRITSIFIGGGTPSLLSAGAYDQLLSALRSRLPILPNAEITLEANPGTFEQQRFKDYFSLGINRLSIGIQSFNERHLKKLGRIHGSEEATRAIDIAYRAGFKNVNVDLMHGLPEQSIEEALDDLKTALRFAPPHLSWYQLTLEPNTVFYKHPPTLPHDNVIDDMQQQGQLLLREQGYHHYEVSAYATSLHQCKHNRHYWEFGDYLGIGAGAHSKITDLASGTITRYAKKKLPKAYMDKSSSYIADENRVSKDAIAFEFMLNALRLCQSIPLSLFTERTLLSIDAILPMLTKAEHKGLIVVDEHNMTLTALGQRFLDDVVAIFLPREQKNER